MKDYLATLLVAFSIFIILIVAVVSLFPYPRAPLGLQVWMPIPIACAGYSCVTYRELSALVNKNVSKGDPEKILTALILRRATGVVANYEKIRVSKQDAEQTIETIEKTMESVPGGKRILDETYGNAFAGVAKNDIISLLQRQKMQALGIDSPWDSEYAPKITVWNIGMKWDNERKQIVER